MTAGLPGVGIGGIFYLASALLMPMRSLVAMVSGRGHEARWPVALRQAAIALGILGALWATGLALAWSITALAPEAAWSIGIGGSPGQMHNVVRTSALLLSFGTLALVLTLVQLLRVMLPARPTEHSEPSASRESARPAA
jgi:hypothetical protein